MRFESWMGGVVLAVFTCLGACAGSSASPPVATTASGQPETAESKSAAAEPSVDEPAGSESETPTRCLRSEDCPSGVCEGEGCDDDHPGQCVPAVRGCTKDLRPYCGCDGRTFRTSGSCPGRRYAHRGPCEEAPPTEP